LRLLKAREGDFLQSSEGLFFDVKGFIHPPDRIIAYLRYLKDLSGDRKRANTPYRKVYTLTERAKILRSRYPQYLYDDPVLGENIQAVLKKNVSKIYKPSKKFLELLKKPSLDRVESQAIEFVNLLHDSSNVKIGKIGISGSILVNLQTKRSDIDVVVYGRENCITVYKALNRLLDEGNDLVSKYNLKDLERLYVFRSKDTQMPLREFIQIEQKKYMQGKFRERDFFMRFLLDWNEIDEKYGDIIYVPSGYAQVEATILDDSNSIYTPCRYLIDEVKFLKGEKTPSLKEITSFRGRFCEQARKGQRVIAQGKVEKVVDKAGQEYFRLILGSKLSDFMINRPVS
jgi:predicted nucleotidyltransferase